MKKLNLLIATLILTGMSFMTSCTKDATSTPPNFMLNAAPGYTGTDVTVPVNTELKVGIIASSTSAKLSNLTIKQAISGGATTTLVDTTFSTDSFNKDFTITSPSEVGSLTLTFIISAADGESAQASFMITTTSAPINTYTAILMGGQLNPELGSFYSTESNSVLKIGAASAAPAKVDFGYYFGTANEATISAPSDNAITAVTNFEAISGWNPRNNTKMKAVTIGVDWASITTESEILANTTSLTDTKVAHLAVNDIVAFETAATSTNPGKKGLFKVINLTGTTLGTDRSITIEVKIQK
jgi:hypothetical protein